MLSKDIRVYYTQCRWRHFFDHIGSSLEMTVYTYFPNLMCPFCSRMSMHRIWNWIKYGQKNKWKSLCSVWNALPTFTITRYYSCCNRRRVRLVRHIAEYFNRKSKNEWMKYCLIYQLWWENKRFSMSFLHCEGTG